MEFNNLINAYNSRNVSRNVPLIHDEIRNIESKILRSSREGFFEVVVDDTYMTSSPMYYQSWKENADDEKSDQMNFVIKYFQDNGYFINRITNVSSLSTFKWVIRW